MGHVSRLARWTRSGGSGPHAALLPLVLALLVGAPPVLHAVYTGQGTAIEIPAGQVVDETAFLFGETVVVDGEIQGDLFVSCRAAKIRGRVEGNLFLFAQQLELDGEVEGGVHVFSQWANIGSDVGGNLYSFSQSLQLNEEARVGRDAFLFGDTVSLEGTVGRDANLFAASLSVMGEIGRHLSSQTDRIILHDGASVGGDVSAVVAREERVEIAPGARIRGETSTSLLDTTAARTSSRYATSEYYLWRLGRLAAAFVLGVILLLLFPPLVQRRAPQGGKAGFYFFLGLLVLLAGPLIILILILTLVGIPLAVVLTCLYLAAFFLAKVVAGGWLGTLMVGESRRGFVGAALGLLVGLVLIYLLISLPYVGFMLHLAVLGLGYGILAFWIHGAVRGGPRLSPPRPETPSAGSLSASQE